MKRIASFVAFASFWLLGAPAAAQDQRDLLFRVQPGTVIELKLWPSGEGDLTIPAEWTVTRTRITKASSPDQVASVRRCGGAMCVQGLSGHDEVWVNANHPRARRRFKLVVLSGGDSRPSGVWTRSGSGASVISAPASVVLVRITARFNGRIENFIVKCGTQGDSGLIVNEILGTSRGQTRYDGLHPARGQYGSRRGQPCGGFVIERSGGVSWTFTQSTAQGLQFRMTSTGNRADDEAAVEAALREAAAGR